MALLEYRAGSTALEILRQRGLNPDDIETLVLPAIGPKWLVLAGFDRALLKDKWLEAQGGRVLLFGSSVGAWRALALSARDPLRAHAALVDRYCAQHFTHADSPEVISSAYRRLLEEVLSEADLAHALQHPRFDIAISAARVKWSRGHEGRNTQALTLGGAALLNAVSTKAQSLFFERVTFATESASNAPASMLHAQVGSSARLTTHNVREVALATGTVPLYMQNVRDIPGAPPGIYIDGGFSDYHLNRPLTGGRGITVLFLHQRRIVPSWLDKFVPWRRSAPDTLSRLLLVYPSTEFVRSLPGSAVPTRDDFKRFVDARDVRIERWHQVVAQSEHLGEAFLREAKTGALVASTLPL